MKSYLAVLALGLGGLVGMRGPALAAKIASPAMCTTLSGDPGTATALPHVAAGLRAGRLSILAIGSARSFAQSQRGPSGAPGVPWQMAQALKSAYPGLEVSLTGRGGRGLTASALVRVIRAELRARPYQLVLWQTGTVEAVHNIQPDDFTDSLLQGIDAVGARGADLVFIDQQYSRFLEGNTDLEPYRRALERVATRSGVALFRRFALMRHWASEGRLDLELAAPRARRALIDQLHTCLGILLARFIVAGADAAHP